MRPLQLSELAAPLEAGMRGADVVVTGVSIDSRRVGRGELFVALEGENFDGHDYLQQAQQRGAAAAVVSRDKPLDIPCLAVVDTQRALGQLGAFNRSLFSGTLVAITGSSGKTTAKNLVAAVLSQQGVTLATAGNFNNEIGVPLTLLRLDPTHRYAVIEMGAARGGDIGWLVELGRPSVAVLLNAMPAHLESFGTVEDVARAKSEIFSRLEQGDVAVFCADQPWAQQWRAGAGQARILDFGLATPGAAVRAADIHSRGFAGIDFTAETPVGEFAVSLKLAGRHNVMNALAAIAVGIACDVPVEDIRAGLAAVAPVAGRLAVVATRSGATLVDDCYNAQPGSVKAAIDLLAQSGGCRTLVLGAMLELGPASEALHIEVAEYARDAGIEQLWGVGPELAQAVVAFGPGGRFFQHRAEAIEAIDGTFASVDTVLVKGSRGAGMETVLAAIAAQPATGEGA